MKYKIGEQEFDIVPARVAGRLAITINGVTHSLETHDRDDSAKVITVDGHRVAAHSVEDGDDLLVQIDGEVTRVHAVTAFEMAGGGGGAKDIITAPMPGTMIKVAKAAGDYVGAKDEVLVIESMKLQTSITAGRNGEIAELPVGEGETFNKGAVLVRFVTEDDEGDA